MAVEDQARRAAETTSSAQTIVKDQENKLKTKGKVFVMEQIVNGLPPPVNVAAKALGEGLTAALKVPVDGVIQPAAPNEDPIKLMAYAMAFAILKAIWCFIKSILNPLPIIGFFFSLCSDDPQLTGVTVRRNLSSGQQLTNDEKEKLKADNDTQNISSAVNLRNVGNRTQQPETNALRQANARLTDAKKAEASIARTSEMNSGDVGITFDQFVARTATGASETVAGPNITNDLLGQTNQGQTSANIPAQPAVEPEWQSGDRPSSSEPLSYQEYRKLFGL